MRIHTTIRSVPGTLLALGLSVTLLGGCKNQQQAEVMPGEDQAIEVASAGLSGAQLWARTCAHCHNSRSPAGFSDAKWKVVVAHMRQQAYLTGEDTQKILEFLQASN